VINRWVVDREPSVSSLVSKNLIQTATADSCACYWQA